MHGDAVGSRMGPNINCAPIRDSRAIRRAPSGPVGPNQGSDGNPSEPDIAREDPTRPDGSLSHHIGLWAKSFGARFARTKTNDER